MTVRLNDPHWIAVTGGKAGDDEGAFREALANLRKIGLVFGSTAARGHDVLATDPARFELLSFSIRQLRQHRWRGQEPPFVRFRAQREQTFHDAQAATGNVLIACSVQTGTQLAEKLTLARNVVIEEGGPRHP